MKRISHFLSPCRIPQPENLAYGACAAREKDREAVFRSVPSRTIGVRGKQAALLTTIDTVLKSTEAYARTYAAALTAPRASCMELPQLTPVTPLCQFRLKIPHCTVENSPPLTFIARSESLWRYRIAEDRSPVPLAFVESG